MADDDPAEDGGQRPLDPHPGTYALVLEAPQRRRIPVGRLGDVEIDPGYYVYVGSAFGPGGVRARLEHYRKRPSRPHWHIDYLRSHARPLEVWYSHDGRRREHQWARILRSVRGASAAASGFGASGCGCESHLVYFRDRPSGDRFAKRLRRQVPEHKPVRVSGVGSRA